MFLFGLQRPLVALGLLLGLAVCLTSLLGPLLVQAIGLAELFPWLLFGRFKVSEQWKSAIMDQSNDDLALVSTHELIRQAGFDYENYYALSDDGYITQLIRIVNPLADANYIRYPPVMVQHGQTANSRNFVLQSVRQHRPMAWPRHSATANQGADPQRAKENQDSLGGFFNWDKLPSVPSIPAIPSILSENFNLTSSSSSSSSTTTTTTASTIASAQENLQLAASAPESSNRSLAFMLANNGFDVWLSSNRGVDENNLGFIGRPAVEKMLFRREIESKIRNMTNGEFELMWQRVKASYWAYTLDDQIAHEMPSQILTILKVTGAKKISLVGYSNSAMTTLAMLSIREDIAQHVDATVSIAPVVYYSKLDGWFQWVAGELLQIFPKALDAELFISARVADFARALLTRVCKPIPVRYTLCKFLIDSTFGSSDQFKTNLELPFFGHMFRPTSWKCMAQHLQIIKTHRLAKFDYGPKLNGQYYGTEQAPEYNISRINSNVHIGLVAGDLDCWANPATLDKIRKNLARPPAFDLALKDYNHVDLTCGFDVDVRVNLPILKYLNQRADVCERELFNERQLETTSREASNELHEESALLDHADVGASHEEGAQDLGWADDDYNEAQTNEMAQDEPAKQI